MAKRKKTIIEVDADTWAESGGTAGMFGKAWREGRLRILSSEERQPPDYEPIVREVKE